MDGRQRNLSTAAAVAPFPLETESQVIWSYDGDRRCELVSGRKINDELFNDILKVRHQTDDRWPDQRTPVDEYSDHYCMYVDGQPVGSLGVTRALDGDVYLHEYCPPPLVDEFHDSLVSAYRFRILHDFRRSSQLVPDIALSRHMVREAWREQISKGANLDLINIEKTHVPLYQRMGYVVCDGYDYLDPILGTPSCLMFLPVDPDRPSFIRDIIMETDVRLPVARVLRALTRSRVSVNSSR
ncbi:MAG: hypothetical protein U0136_11295 [Bdellovibrionota bacterium]